MVIGFKVLQGKKHLKDKVLAINTYEDWHIITLAEILTIVQHMFDNEDVLYPRPKYMGRAKFLNYILEEYIKGLKKEVQNG